MLDGLPDNLQPLLDAVPAYVLVFFRVAGLMLFSPLFGSSRIPRRFKLMIALVLALGMVQGGLPEGIVVPDTVIGLALAIGSEMVFGIAIGMIASFVFIAAQWAGEMIGQQLGFNLSEVFDPQFSAGGSIIGELYFLLTMTVFLTIGGHREMIAGVHESLHVVPPASLIFTPDLFATVTGMLTTTLTIALRLAAPVFVTMMIVDVAMGSMSRTMPQFNVMSAGLSVRALVGMLVVALGVAVVTGVIDQSIVESLGVYRTVLSSP